MADSYYEGLCLGGPLDGTRHVATTPYFETYGVSPSLMAADMRERPRDVTNQRGGYDYVLLTHMQGVWLSVDLREPDRGLSQVAVEVLTARYRRK